MLHGWIICFFYFLFFFYSPLLEAFQWSGDVPHIIRVRLGIFPRFTLNGYDLKINNRAQLEEHKRLEITCTQNGFKSEIRLGNIGIYPSPLSLEASGGYIFVNGDGYRNKIMIHEKDQQCIVVNELDIENYVAGVINNEMQANWPLEALKAQAITARSYALSIMKNSTNPIFHVDNTTKDQMYRGVYSETVRSNLATSSTRGTVLFFKKDILRTYYHANCGGRTELPESIWGKTEDGAYKSVYCPYHYKKPTQQNWVWKVQAQQLESSLRKVAGILPNNFLRVASLSQGALTPGERYKSLVVTDTRGKSVEIPVNTFRQSLGFQNIRSAKFQMIAGESALEFRGIGNGHGVGMCQLGAKEMALEGKNHISILKYYYPLARLANLY